MLDSAEDEQTLEDTTALPNKESASETGDSDADPNYSLSNYSYSDISDNKSSSFDDVNVSALNELQNMYLTTEKENTKPKNRKRKRVVQSGKLIELKCYEIQDTHTDPLMEVLKYLNGS
jgi:hypothetical protein